MPLPRNSLIIESTSIIINMLERHIVKVKALSQPELTAPNPWELNSVTRHCLSHYVRDKTLQQELLQFGELCNKNLFPLALDAAANPPTLVKYDVYGKTIDQIVTTEGWRKQKEEAARQKIVALAYEDRFGDLTRLVQLIRLQMYQPVSGLYGCPLAMTDGAAYLLQQWLQNPTTSCEATTNTVKQAFQNLTSSDPQRFWTSGQWMTEKNGGSDVSQATETIAVQQGGTVYRLYGYKWFSSATDSDVSLALARIVPADNQQDIRKFPLSLFLLRVKNENGKLNSIEIVTLKDKMGTRQLPTAELLLNGTEAYLISEPGKGVKAISHMLNVTRLYNASSATGSMNRLYGIVLNYSNTRQAFGKKLSQLAAHQALLTKFSLNCRACNLFYFKISYIFSRIHSKTATPDEDTIFRMMIPLLKLYTAKICMYWMSEGMEALGALGYMENSHIPTLYRDAQVLTIWEGTTNVLCLDFLRALKSTDPSDPLQKLDVYCRFSTHVMMTFLSADTNLPETKKSVVEKLAKLTNNHNGVVAELSNILRGQSKSAERRIRDLAFILCESFIGLLFLGMISANGLSEDITAFELWCESMQSYQSAWSNNEQAFSALVRRDLEKARL